MPLAPIYTTSAIRDIERRAGTPLMERAGHAAAELALSLLPGRSGKVLLLAGPGNNGGDAFVVARQLRANGQDAIVLFHGGALPPDAAAAHHAWNQAGGATISQWPEDYPCDLIVDGLFGIGLTRAVGDPYAGFIAKANQSQAPILALDIASGLHADTGVASGPTIRATHTATFIALKPGLLTADGTEGSGKISTHGLGLQVEHLRQPDGFLLQWPEMRLRVQARRSNAHKGTHGTLAVIGGADGMTGACLLAGRAAIHTGAGKVILGMLGDKAPTVDLVQPELMLRKAEEVTLDSLSAVAVGPGLGRSSAGYAALDRALHSDLPLVLDADALNTLAEEAVLARALQDRRAATLLTPHPAEAGRLLKCTTEAVQQNRIHAAQRLVEQFHCGVVLKGAGSICVLRDYRWFINGTGNAGLATAGTGDVLTGFIGAMLAQGYSADDAVLIAVCLHGAAADLLVQQGVGPIGLTASELLREARVLLNA